MNTLLTAIYNLLASMHPAVKAVLFLGSVLLAINSYIETLWAELFTKVDTIAAGTFTSADFSALGLVNYVFPLDTVCTFLTAYMGLTLVCAAIRIIKSFVPTISG